MEILICQSCGDILRSQGKSCKGCGALATRHTSTALAQVDPSASALSVVVQNDPLVLERTVNHIMYGKGNGNGNGNNGNGNGYGAEPAAPVAYPGFDTIPSAPTAAIASVIGMRSGLPLSAPSSQPENTAPAAEFEPAGSERLSQFAEPTHQIAQPPNETVQAEPSGGIEPVPVSAARPDSYFTAHMQAPGFVGGQLPSEKKEFFSDAPGPVAEAIPDQSPYRVADEQVRAGEPSSQAVVEPGQTAISEPIKSDAELVTALASRLEPVADLNAKEIAESKIAESPASGDGLPKDHEREQHPHFPSTAAAFADPWQKSGVMDFFSANPPAGPKPDRQPGRTTVEAVQDKQAGGNDLTFKPGRESGADDGTEQAVARLLESRLEQAETETVRSRSKKKTSQAGSRDSSSEDEDDDEEDEEDDDDDDKEKKRDKGKDRPKRVRNDRFHHGKKESVQTVEILGRSFSKNTLITTGIIAVVVGFPFMVLLSCICSIFSGGQGAGQGGGQAVVQVPAQTTAQAPAQGGQAVQQGLPVASGPPSSMTGKWQFEYENVGSTKHGHGIFTLNQAGDKVEGSGADDSGQFQLSGTVQGDTARFNKVYIQGGKPVGKPIAYAGKVSIADNVMKLLGNWEVTKRQGFGWRAQIVTLGGRFGALLVQPGAGGGEVAGNQATIASAAVPSGDANVAGKDPKKAQNFFMQVALGIIGIGVLLAMVSLRFFGPSGLLNIWAKKEYIPSQFKSQHFKMVKEMGKPITTGGLPLGTREEWGLHQFWLPRRLNMPEDLREKNPHLFMIGAGATGKTRLMASMIAQDIESNDRAVVLVDSDGGLADLILNWIASRPNGAEIVKRVIVVDPTYKGGQPLGYNPLEFPEDEDLQNAASALVSGFKAAYTEPPGAQSQWNQQTANILRNSSILLMANNKTLTDLPVLLSDNDFRDVLLERIEQLKAKRSEFITLIDAWTNYKRLARTDQWITWIEPILNRVQPMLSDPRIRTILTKEKSELNLKRIISEKKILIVKIPQGQLDKNGNLLGSLMVAGVKQAALSLGARSKHKRRPCSLYLDEFESFIEKETFDAITTETRKLQIGFCGASKTLQTMPEDFRNKIIINCGIMAIFALAKKDADMLGPQMFRVDGRKVKHQTIQNVFNKVNTSPQFELIMDEEKLNIDRVVGQEKRTYFCYRVGSVAGVFHMKAPEFADIEEGQINPDLIDKMHINRQDDPEDSDGDDDADDESEEDDDDEEE